MALERKWLGIPPVSFTADGTQFGVVTVADTLNFKDKQDVYIKSNTQDSIGLRVQQVLSNTQLVVGPKTGPLSPTNFTNISAYLVADGATIGAEEQPKSAQPTEKDHYFAIYESSPVNADRIIPVDPYGNLIGPTNPLPVSFAGTISIGEVEIVGPAPDRNPLIVNPDGSINVIVESAPSSSSVVVSTYSLVSAIPSGSTVQIVSYTIPVGKQGVLQRCSVSGDNIGKYTLFINGTAQDALRTMFGGDLSCMFDFTSGNDSGLLLAAGDQISIKVFNPRPYPADFNGRIQVLIFT